MQRSAFCRAVLLSAVVGPLTAATAPLAVVSPGISDTDGGVYLPAEYKHVPGETLFLSFQVAGYQTSSADKVHLSYKIEAFDPHKVAVIEPLKGEVEDTLAPEDKNWKPVVRQEITLPPTADSGTYQIAIAVTDEVSHQAAAKAVTFEVRGHRVEASDILVIRNFHFFRREEDTQPLEKAAYRPGDAVWARFDIVGYKYGDGHGINVTYDVAVIAPNGKVLYSQANAAQDQTQSFYPKRYVPGSMSLNLQSNIHPGEYAMVITAHDQVGNQTSESRQSFTIE
jgi:hypothetical protein